MTAALLAGLLAATPAAPATPSAKPATPATPARGCLPATPLPGLGVVDPFRPPDPKATELNSAGKSYYRDGKWEEARIEYRAAETADPTFLAPRLNIACSFVRQERFAEATAEVEALLARASTLNSLLPAGSSMVSRIGFPSRSRTPSALLSR